MRDVIIDALDRLGLDGAKALADIELNLVDGHATGRHYGTYHVDDPVELAERGQRAIAIIATQVGILYGLSVEHPNADPLIEAMLASASDKLGGQP